MRFDQDGVPGGQGGEEGRIAVPGGEDAVGDHQGDAPGHHGEGLVQGDGAPVAEGFAPGRAGGQPRLLLQGAGHRLQAAVLRVHGARVEGHEEVVAAGVDGGVREGGALRVDPVEDLRADGRARLGAGVAPGREGGGHGGQQDVGVAVRVGDPQQAAERRAFTAALRVRAHRAVPAGLAEFQRSAEQRAVGRLPGGDRPRSVGRRVLRVLGVGRPVFTGADGLAGTVEGGAVPGEELVHRARSSRLGCRVAEVGDGPHDGRHDPHPCLTGRCPVRTADSEGLGDHTKSAVCGHGAVRSCTELTAPSQGWGRNPRGGRSAALHSAGRIPAQAREAAPTRRSREQTMTMLTCRPTRYSRPRHGVNRSPDGLRRVCQLAGSVRLPGPYGPLPAVRHSVIGRR